MCYTYERPHRFILSEEPADLTAGKRDGLGGQGGRVDVAAHENIHLFFGLHFRLLWTERG